MFLFTPGNIHYYAHIKTALCRVNMSLDPDNTEHTLRLMNLSKFHKVITIIELYTSRISSVDDCSLSTDIPLIYAPNV